MIFVMIATALMKMNRNVIWFNFLGAITKMVVKGSKLPVSILCQEEENYDELLFQISLDFFVYVHPLQQNKSVP